MGFKGGQILNRLELLNGFDPVGCPVVPSAPRGGCTQSSIVPSSFRSEPLETTPQQSRPGRRHTIIDRSIQFQIRAPYVFFGSESPPISWQTGQEQKKPSESLSGKLVASKLVSQSRVESTGTDGYDQSVVPPGDELGACPVGISGSERWESQQRKRSEL